VCVVGNVLRVVVGARAFMASHAHVMWAVGGQCMIVMVLAVAIVAAMAAVIKINWSIDINRHSRAESNLIYLF
jgi:hypothetical protein